MDGVRRQLSEAWVAKLVAYANSFFMKIHVPGYTFTSQLPFKTDNQPGGRSDVWIRERASHRGCLAHALQWGPGSAVGRGRTLHWRLMSWVLLCFFYCGILGQSLYVS